MIDNSSLTLSNRMSETTFSTSENKTVLPRRSIPNVLASLNSSAGQGSPLLFNQGAHFEDGGRRYDLPRYLFLGPKGGDEPLRIGIFAGIHGDEPEGVHALLRFLGAMAKDPELGRGYCFFAYPICNPTGFEDRTRN